VTYSSSGDAPVSGALSRAVAVELLRSVLRDRRPLDHALEDHPLLPSLEGRDRSHVRMIVATTLRRLGQIDRAIARHLRRPLPDRASIVHDVLRVGSAELLFLRTPPHAAVDTAVWLTAHLGFAGHKGLVNAVLRRVAGHHSDGTEGLPVGINTPGWLYESWVSAYGEHAAEAIAAAHLDEAPLDITLKRDDDALRYAEALDAQTLSTGTLRRRGGGSIRDLPGFEDGDWWIQDAAAALPVRLLGDIAGRPVIDLAAAPGGKTAQLIAAGAVVTAVDRSAPRMLRLQGNLDRLRLRVAEAVVADAVTWRPEQMAERVIVDVPCSATGTIRRHPDLPYLKSRSDVARLAELQRRMLRAAVDMTVPGGIIVYACCSLQPEEGRQQVDALIASGAPVVHDSVNAADVRDHAEFISPCGDLRTMPYHLGTHGGMDGFFASRLRRLP